MKKATALIILSIFFNNTFAQNNSPYRTNFKYDAPIIAGEIGLSYLGLTIIKNKKDLSISQVQAKNKSDVFFTDRFSAGYNSDKADKDSYIPFYASFAMPIVMLLNKNESSHAGQIMVMFVETMATTATIFTLTDGLVDRSRPLVYNTSLSVSERADQKEQRSFFAGHTAATAAATFFGAKVFADFNSDSKAKTYVWAAAAAVPAVVGYLRLKAGKHFLSDNLVGYGIGAASGILIPQLHKITSSQKLSIQPLISPQYQKISFIYHIN